MSSFSVKVLGAIELVTELNKIVGNAFTIMDVYTKATLPQAINNETPIRSGNLREGNKVETRHTGHELQVSFTNDVLYAKFVIDGTSRMKANNYVERASQRYQVKLDYYTRDWLTKLQ
jgi:hypothetical protein